MKNWTSFFYEWYIDYFCAFSFLEKMSLTCANDFFLQYDDVLCTVFANMTQCDLAPLRLVCKHWNSMIIQECLGPNSHLTSESQILSAIREGKLLQLLRCVRTQRNLWSRVATRTFLSNAMYTTAETGFDKIFALLNSHYVKLPYDQKANLSSANQPFQRGRGAQLAVRNRNSAVLKMIANMTQYSSHGSSLLAARVDAITLGYLDCFVAIGLPAHQPETTLKTALMMCMQLRHFDIAKQLTQIYAADLNEDIMFMFYLAAVKNGKHDFVDYIFDWKATFPRCYTPAFYWETQGLTTLYSTLFDSGAAIHLTFESDDIKTVFALTRPLRTKKLAISFVQNIAGADFVKGMPPSWRVLQTAVAVGLLYDFDIEYLLHALDVFEQTNYTWDEMIAYCQATSPATWRNRIRVRALQNDVQNTIEHKSLARSERKKSLRPRRTHQMKLRSDGAAKRFGRNRVLLFAK